ncbi:amino acid ABC transporter permease [Mesorhizobium sp. M1423]|uniref:amino acid ABC transporter permease n=1 Tax=Mesorhizobium sp. M1423 TaxID=2957101 RepID=UPI003334E607
MNYQWDFAVILRSNGMLIGGLLGTLDLTIMTVVIAAPLGFLLSLVLLSRHRTPRFIARCFVDFFRTSALLVLIIWFYFAFPIVTGLRVNSFQAAALALGLQNAAYLAEVFRAGISSVAQGQWEAAKALGLHRVHVFCLVIAPQALRSFAPVLFNVLTEIIKGTALAAAIAYGELSFEASRIASSTYRPLETYTIVAAIYFALIFLLSQVFRRIEMRMAVGGAVR